MDPLTGSALVVIGLHSAPAATAAKLLERLLAPSFDAVGEALVPTSLRVWKEQRDRRAVEILNKTGQIIDSGKQSPTPVPGRILWPILEHGSLEDDSDLRSRYAALLATASIAPADVLPAFVSVLAELSSAEVGILAAVRSSHDGDYNPSRGSARLAEVQQGLSVDQLRLAVTNLVRLNLATSDLDPAGLDVLTNDEFLQRPFILTRFGVAFVGACS